MHGLLGWAAIYKTRVLVDRQRGEFFGILEYTMQRKHSFFTLHALHCIAPYPPSFLIRSFSRSIYLICDLTTHRPLARLPTVQTDWDAEAADKKQFPPSTETMGREREGGKREGGPIGSRHQRLTLDWAAEPVRVRFL